MKNQKIYTVAILLFLAAFTQGNRFFTFADEETDSQIAKHQAATETPKPQRTQKRKITNIDAATGKITAKVEEITQEQYKKELRNELLAAAQKLLEKQKAEEDYFEKNDKHDNDLELAVAEYEGRVGEIFAKLEEYGTAYHFFLSVYLTGESVLGKDNEHLKKIYEKIKYCYEKDEEEDEPFDEMIKNGGLRDLAERRFLSETLQELKERLQEFVQGKKQEWIESVFNKDLKEFGDDPEQEQSGDAKAIDQKAVDYYNKKEYVNALLEFQKALAIREKELGKEHTDTGINYLNLASTYEKLNDSENALKYYLQAVVVEEKTLGKDHIETADTYNKIGVHYRKLENYGKAMEFYQKALTIREKELGKDNLDTAITYNNIGNVYYFQKKYPQALRWWQKSYDIRQKKLGAEHEDTKTVLENIEAVKKVVEKENAGDLK